jgi:hypothetical protein
MPSRRTFLKDASLLGVASVTWASGLSAQVRPRLDIPQASPRDLARDEAFWSRVAAQYRVPTDVINLEGGYFGLMAMPVLEAFHRHTDRANSGSSFFARRIPAIYQSRARRCRVVGASRPAHASQNATGLQALISQHNKVDQGTVMYADLDYNAMQWAMNFSNAQARLWRGSISPNPPATRAWSRPTAGRSTQIRREVVAFTSNNNRVLAPHEKSSRPGPARH